MKGLRGALAGVVAAGAAAAIMSCATLAAPSSAATKPAAKCPLGAASCVTTPYRNGPFGKGSAGLGLLLTGSRGMGGTQFEVTDREASGKLAPEVWISDGTLYVLTKPGWLGRGICVDVALKANYCLTAQDIRFLHRLEGRRG